jgi:hypothetical protein
VTDQWPATVSSADLEAGKPFGLLLGDLYGGDLGATRPPATELDHPLDRVRLALEDRLDGALGRVADPARYARRLGASLGRVPEEDSLDAPADDDPLPGQ